MFNIFTHNFRDKKLDDIYLLLKDVAGRQKRMAADVTGIIAQLNANISVEQSALEGINWLIQAFRDAQGDPVAIQAAIDAGQASATALAAAIANIPAH